MDKAELAEKAKLAEKDKLAEKQKKDKAWRKKLINLSSSLLLSSLELSDA